MFYKDSKELCKKMAEKSDGMCLLAFSCGKDSISAWIELKKYFTEIIPVYYYLVPGISFIEKSISYYEEFFETRIIRLPNPLLYRMLNSGMYQSPETWNIIKKFQFPVPTREDMAQYIREDYKLPNNCYIAVGNRMSDNPYRRMAIKRFGPVSEKSKTFYPIYDFNIKDVVASIKEVGVKLPIDYHLFGKSFDGLDYRFIYPIKKYFPEDFKKIKEIFPFIDNETIRYEQL